MLHRICTLILILCSCTSLPLISQVITDGWESKNIGPSICSGRVVDFEVNPQNHHEYYVAYATGGLWHTNNSGTSFTPLLDEAPFHVIGSIAVDWDKNHIWVGTGEVNSSRSSYAGDGLYLSADSGKTWIHMGLEDTRHISDILIQENGLLVSSIGALYSTNKERGIYHSNDQGASWTATLSISDSIGIIDLQPDITDKDVIYAASWERRRYAWHFKGSGLGSAVYKSTDQGLSWSKLSSFPNNTDMGRIALASAKMDQDGARLFALIDNQKKKPKKEDELSMNDILTMSSDEVVGLDNDELNALLKKNYFPKQYDADSIKTLLKSKEIVPADVYNYLGENANLILGNVVGAELHHSDDKGVTWQKTNTHPLDKVYNTYGYYFGTIAVNPRDYKEVYIAGVPILKSTDGGKTFESIDEENVHADHHKIWVNPNNSQHIMSGNDGGMNTSYDGGEHWQVNNSPEVGQFYSITLDNEKPFQVYGGLQDNGVWRGPSDYKSSTKWLIQGDYPYKKILGGDGMQTAVDPRNTNIVYTGLQFGNYFRLDLANNTRKPIKPQYKMGEEAYRWNWQTPIHLSVHHPDIVYIGANRVFRSMNQGDDFIPISEDLTLGGKTGNVSYGTLTCLTESPFQFGHLFAGSDDGRIHKSLDGGYTWHPIYDHPEQFWVSNITPSQHNEQRIYIAYNNYRNDDSGMYIYTSEDGGDTWSALSNSFEKGSVNTIAEDPHHENIIYVGSDVGAFVSLDRGQNFEKIRSVPNVPVHDIKIQKEQKTLVIGTHGRSIYTLDLEKYYKIYNSKETDLVLFSPDSISLRKSKYDIPAYKKFPTEDISFQIYSTKKQNCNCSIKADNKKIAADAVIQLSAGFNSIAIAPYTSTSLLKDTQYMSPLDNGYSIIKSGEYTLECIPSISKRINKPLKVTVK